MGSTTRFSGSLTFSCEMTDKMFDTLAKLINYSSPSEWPEWADASNLDCYYIQLKLNDDKTGICWDGSEKFYDSVDAVNFVIRNMQIKYPQFGLEGKMLASGEEAHDVWILAVEDNLAKEKPFS